MGREIRMVPPNWEHPKTEKPDWNTGGMVERYEPLYDRSCEQAWAEWQKEFIEWNAGEHQRIANEHGADDYPLDQPYTAFCRWHGSPPRPERYRPQWADGEATWFQVYETVSEGTPVSPPFETQEELIDYLVENGDFWDQRRRADGVTTINCDPWSREAAERFVRQCPYMPSMIVANGVVKTGSQIMES